MWRDHEVLRWHQSRHSNILDMAPTQAKVTVIYSFDRPKVWLDACCRFCREYTRMAAELNPSPIQ